MRPRDWSRDDRIGLSRFVPLDAQRLLPGVNRLVLAGYGPMAVAAALYNRLCALPIYYDLEPFNTSEMTQVIREPSELLHEPGRGTCLDAAVLFAGLLLDYDLWPIVVVLDGHALTMVSRRRLVRDQFPVPGEGPLTATVTEDHDALRGLVSGGEFAAVECTGFLHMAGAERVDGVLTFDAAVDAGRRALDTGTLVFAVDAATARHRSEIGPHDFDTPLVNQGRADHAEHVMPHDHAMWELRRRARFLVDGQLDYVSPGPDNPSDPQNLLASLGAEGSRVVLVTGAAGTGKTRTCIEVAILADREGWRVLHVRPDTALTNEQLAAAVLAEPTAHTLLFIDYLDVCGGLDLAEVLDLVAVRTVGEAGRLAILTTARPMRLAELTRRSARRLLHVVSLRPNRSHERKVARQILLQVAGQATRRIGFDPMLAICGLRPVITLLVARDLEEAGGAGPHPRGGTGRSALVEWLRRRLIEDTLFDDDQESTRGGSFGGGEPQPVLLACALAAAVCPLDLVKVETLIQPLLDRAATATRGRTVVAALCRMGWLEQVGDQLEVVHDVVTDQFLIEATMPTTLLAVDDLTLAALLNCLTSHPRALDHFAGNLARVHADLDDPTLASGVSRTCAEWLAASRFELGQALARSADGGHALYTMLHADPWRTAVRDQWEEVVQPWLSSETRDGDVVEFLSYALSRLPRGEADRVMVTALVWLVQHRTQIGAALVLSALVRRDDLLHEQRLRVNRDAVLWSAAAPDSAETAPLLRGLLTHPSGCAAEDEQAVDTALDWLRDRALTPSASGVHAALLARRQLPAAAGRSAVELALRWCGRHADACRAWSVLRPLLARHGLPAAALSQATDLALHWLNRHRLCGVANFVLNAALTRGRLEPDRRAVVFNHASAWLAVHAAEPQASFVLSSLLSCADLPLDSAAWHIQQALRWLDLNPDDDKAASYVLRSLVSCVGRDIDAMLAVQIGRTVLDWLTQDPHRPGSGHVLAALLGSRRLSERELTGLIDIGRGWLQAHPDGSGAGRLIEAMVGNLYRTPGSVDEVADNALQWMAQHPDAADISFLLAALLHCPNLTSSQFDLFAEFGLGWLGAHPNHPAGEHVLDALLDTAEPDTTQAERTVDHAIARLGGNAPADLLVRDILRSPCLARDRATAVLEAAFGWVDRHPEHRAVGGVVAAVLHGPHAGTTSELAIDAAIGWLDRASDVRALRHFFAAVRVQPDSAHRDRLVSAIVAWLDAALYHACASHAIIALLSSGAEVADGRVVDATLRWLDRIGDDPQVTYVLQALLEAGLIPSDMRWAVDATLTWLERDGENPGVTYVLQALLDADLHPDDLPRAVRQALEWLFGHLDHPYAGLVLRGLVDNRRIGYEYLTSTVEASLGWLAGNSDHKTADLLLCALVSSGRLKTAEVRRIADVVLDWLTRNPENRAFTRLSSTLLRNRRLPADQRNAATAEALRWLSDYRDVPGSSHLLTALLDNAEPRYWYDTVNIAIGWLHTHRDKPSARYVVEALFRTGSDLEYVIQALPWSFDGPPTDLDESGAARAGCGADNIEPVLGWMDEHEDDSDAILVLHALVGGPATAPIHPDRAVRFALAYLRDHLDRAAVNVVVRTVLPMVRPQSTGSDRALRAAAAWLEANPDDPTAGRLVQALQAHVVDDQVDRLGNLVYQFLDSQPESPYAAGVRETLRHRRRAASWA